MKWARTTKHRPAPRGLGDVVASIAQPIVGVIDRIAGTEIKHCGDCAKRKAAWNKKVPFKSAQLPSPKSKVDYLTQFTKDSVDR